MARKNPFANLRDDGRAPEAASTLTYAMKGASRSLLNSIDEISARADKLIEGETVVDLDPDLVDGSFVQDRFEADKEEFEQLLGAIRERGQDSPILVRPHPSNSTRYMVVFGHRRLKAARLLGRKVRAVVKAMNDRDHVIAQGQENSARANLSFIERASFAARLTQLRYDSDNATVMAALSVDRTTLSKMLSVASAPEDILRAIGAAKGIGRDRWYELKLILEKPSSYEQAAQIIVEEGFSTMPSDNRFNLLFSRLKGSKTRPRNQTGPKLQKWSPDDGAVTASMKAEGKRFTLDIKAKGGDAAAFGSFLSENLSRLYLQFKQATVPGKNGD